jgi:putative ABC transport system permease protein
MVFLALKNLRLRKLRTVISILAVGVGIMTMVVLRGVTEGTIGEVANRMSSIQADLLVWDQSQNAMMHSQTMSAKYADRVRQIDGVRHVVPVLKDLVHLGGQPQTIFAVKASDFDIFGGQKSLVKGRPVKDGARELIVDEVLASVHKGGLKVGQEVEYCDEMFTIVGIAREGVVGRVFASYDTLTELRHNGKLRASMLVVKITEPGRAESVAQAIRGKGFVVVDKGNYYSVIERNSKAIDVFIWLTAGVTLLVSLLTILLTVFTIVQEQTREIGILRSMGATRGAIMRLVISQSLIICSAGIVVGFAMSLAARYVIGHLFPLFTMSMGPLLLATAVGVGIFGGLLGALYPALRAAWLDPVESLSYE